MRKIKENKKFWSEMNVRKVKLRDRIICGVKNMSAKQVL